MKIEELEREIKERNNFNGGGPIPPAKMSGIVRQLGMIRGMHLSDITLAMMLNDLHEKIDELRRNQPGTQATNRGRAMGEIKEKR